MFIGRIVLRIMSTPDLTSDTLSLTERVRRPMNAKSPPPDYQPDERAAAGYHHVGGLPIVGPGPAAAVIGASG
jgi:hypothetical protein